MTNPAELQRLHPEAKITDVACDPVLDPTLPFSTDCLELFGKEQTENLLHTRAMLVDLDQARKQDKPVPGTSELNLQTSAVGQFFQTHPRFSDLGYEFISLIDKRAAIINKSDGPVDEAQLAQLTRRLNNLYHTHKDDLNLLSQDVVLSELNQMAIEVRHQYSLADAIESLFDDHSKADGEARNTLIQHIGDLLRKSTGLDSELINSLFVYSHLELVMGRFAQFEARGSSAQGLEKEMDIEGLLPHPMDKLTDANPDIRFRSPTQVVEQLNTVVELARASDQIEARMTPLYRKFNEVQTGHRIHDAQLMATVAARAFASVEYSVDCRLANEEVEINLDQFPFTLAKRDPEGRIDPNEYATLMVLTKELMLRQPRQELTDFLKDMPLFIDFEAVLSAMFEKAGQIPHTRDLAEARETARSMVKRHLDAMHAETQMVSDVLEGKKPRAKNKNPKPEELEAAALHSKLHSAGFSSNPEKALIIAIVTGKWDQLQVASSQLKDITEAIAGFSDTFGLDSAADHPVCKRAGASFEPLLHSIASIIRRNPSKVMQALSSGNQFAQLKAIVESVTSTS